MGCNIFNNCDILQEKLDEYMDLPSSISFLSTSSISTPSLSTSSLSTPSLSTSTSISSIPIKIDKDEIILVEFNEDCVGFTVSNDEINYIFKPSKNIEIIKNTWFEEEIPKQILYKNLSKISESRKNFHELEYFKNKLKKVYFKYINNELVPFRYSLKKQNEMR
jgi:hypothetical protein